VETYVDSRTGPIFVTSSGRRLDRQAAFRTDRRLAHQTAIRLRLCRLR
jgi:hypothetical protein